MLESSPRRQDIEVVFQQVALVRHRVFLTMALADGSCPSGVSVAISTCPVLFGSKGKGGKDKGKSSGSSQASVPVPTFTAADVASAAQVGPWALSL